jgi:hypothetical protein
MKRIALPLLLAASLTSPAAWADEVITTNANAPPPPAAEAPPPAPPIDEAAKAQAIGDWAQRVMAGERHPEEIAAADRKKGCVPAADRKPHGQVWGSIGTGGYRSVGGVVTQPIGDCSQVTIAVEHTEGGGRWRRR